jgi:hypothetical protein
MFQGRELWLETTAAFAPMTDLVDAIKRAKFVDGRSLELTYLGTDSQEEHVRIRLDVGTLPPIELPVKRSRCCPPVLELDTAGLERHFREHVAGMIGLVIEATIPAGDFCTVTSEQGQSFRDVRERAFADAKENPEIRTTGTRVKGTPARWTYSPRRRQWTSPDGAASTQPPPRCVAALAMHLPRDRADVIPFWGWSEEVVPALKAVGVPSTGGRFRVIDVTAISIDSQTAKADGTTTVQYSATRRPSAVGQTMGLSAPESTFVGIATYRRADDGWH